MGFLSLQTFQSSEDTCCVSMQKKRKFFKIDSLNEKQKMLDEKSYALPYNSLKNTFTLFCIYRFCDGFCRKKKI